MVDFEHVLIRTKEPLPNYAQRVVGNGIRAQSGNPEVRVRGTDPVINQIIDKLRHVIQLLQGRSPKPNKWELLQSGSGGGILEQSSGDCDDEDGCGGSGSGEVKRTLKITNWIPDSMNFSDVKQVHVADRGRTLDTTATARAPGTESMTLTLTGMLMSLPWLW
ncbi:glypican-5 [Acomys russatus]|uniref:glypican-5 n=1 Tax=Acomys russatus TaxID=60746 RepID=UPI0021E2CA37|nr:glypican-5 [Acomys russatus]